MGVFEQDDVSCFTVVDEELFGLIPPKIELRSVENVVESELLSLDRMLFTFALFLHLLKLLVVCGDYFWFNVL